MFIFNLPSTNIVYSILIYLKINHTTTFVTGTDRNQTNLYGKNYVIFFVAIPFSKEMYNNQVK